MAGEYLKFSPSHSERWLNCPGSVRLCTQVPEPPSSKYAMEGTAAHELAANCLRLQQNAEEWIGEEIEVEGSVFKVTQSMAENVQVYLDAIRNDMKREGVPHSELCVEKKFVIKGVTSGTNDASFSSPLSLLYIYDLKYGEGTYVEVERNTQFMLYALGALEDSEFLNDRVKLVVVQPRYTREEIDPVRSWEISVEDLLKFKQEVKTTIALAKTENPPLKSGSHCKWCPAFGVCPAVGKKVVSTVNENYAIKFPEPSSLTPERIVKIIELSELISDWAKAVKGYAETQAIDLGVQFPGYKIVKKTGNRAWIDETAVENEFEMEFGDKIYNKTVKTPAQLEKIVGKERVAELTERPDKGFQLVKENAKGEAVTPNKVFDVLE